MSQVWQPEKIVSPVKTTRSSGHVDGDLAGCVARRVEQVERVVADPQGQVAREDDRALVRVAVVLVAVRPQGEALGVVEVGALGVRAGSDSYA